MLALVSGPLRVPSLVTQSAGLASADGAEWLALAYAPTGVLMSCKAGAKLVDGSMRSTSEGDVVVDSDEGPLRIVLAPLR